MINCKLNEISHLLICLFLVKPKKCNTTYYTIYYKGTDIETKFQLQNFQILSTKMNIVDY